MQRLRDSLREALDYPALCGKDSSYVDLAEDEGTEGWTRGETGLEVKLVVLKEDEFKEIEHFLETGKRLEDVRVTDQWVEERLLRCLQEIRALEDTVDVHWQTVRKLTNVNSAAFQVWKTFKQGGDLAEAMAELGRALRS